MRDHGSGTASRRPDGLWQAQVSLGTGPDGKRRRRSVYAPTKREALQKAKAVRAEFESTGVAVTDRRTTLNSYAETYISGTLEARVVSGKIRRSTMEWHAAMLRHALLVLGHHRLEDITPARIEALTASLADRSPSLRRGVHTALSALLATAVRDGAISRNPAVATDRPKAGDPSQEFLEPEQIRTLLDAADGAMRTAMLILALTGIRRGELLALRWADCDLTTGSIRITGSMSRTKADGLQRTAPKSKSSVRTVPLAEPAAEALRSLWHDRPGLPAAPVFPSAAGTFQEPRAFSRRFAAVAKKADLDCTPKTLRHSAASAMIAAGVALPVASEFLGHSDVRITAGVYVHLIDAQRSAAAAALGAAVMGDGRTNGTSAADRH